MRRRSLAVAALAVALAGSPATAARADSGTALVAIVTAEPLAPLTQRVSAELRALGLDVLVLRPPAEASSLRAPLEQAARAVGAIAAVRLVPSTEGRVEVWVADRVTGKAVVRELDASGNGASDSTVALGTVELFRASLMELHADEPPHGDAPATERVRALALPVPSPAPRALPPPRLALGASAVADLGVSGPGPSVDADVTVWVRLASRAGIRGLALTTVAPAHEHGASGSVDVRTLLFGALVTYDLADAAGRWVPSLGVGIAAARVAVTGTAAPPYVGAADAAWFAAPLASAGVAWAFVRGLRLRSDAVVAWAVPSAPIRTPTDTAGRWAAPAVLISLGAEVLWIP